jgi:hypothetical protein
MYVLHHSYCSSLTEKKIKHEFVLQEEDKDRPSQSAKELVRTINDKFRVRQLLSSFYVLCAKRGESPLLENDTFCDYFSICYEVILDTMFQLNDL